MSELSKQIEKILCSYIQNPDNPFENMNLATTYYHLGQTASAVSFFLRAAERFDQEKNKPQIYYCLFMIGLCFEQQGNRTEHARSMYKRAITEFPEFPEAYYLLARSYERATEYNDGYHYANLALSLCDFDKWRMPSLFPFGKWALKFERAICAWWIGKPKECREELKDLFDNHLEEMDQIHIDTLERNLMNLGSGPESQALRKYTREQHKNLRYQFWGSSNIEENFSQTYQDLFILAMFEGKENGTFLEIGGALPFKGNNTALLERDFNWTGISIENQKQFVDQYRKERPKTKVLHEDALTMDYDKAIRDKFGNVDTIDYLQLDIEPARLTLECLKKIPFDKYKFGVITYEHDHYVDITKKCREESRKFLSDLGYQLLVSNISPDDKSPFEDWWVHPDLVSKQALEKMQVLDDNIKPADKYMLPGPIKQNYSFGVLGSVNNHSSKRAFIVDNFYNDPMAVREFALKQEYIQGGFGRGFIGARTKDQFLFSGLKEKFEEIMGMKITKWEEHGMNGRFQKNIAGEPLVYHCDSQRYAAMIYLTPDAPVGTGTSTFQHRDTKIFHNSHPDILKAFDPECHLDGNKYDVVDRFGNIFNRLVIFDSGCIHAATDYFGWKDENCRLWHMFFFDV